MIEEKSTKERIFETAVKFFASKGFHGSSIRDIAKEVGIKESSIYNHFASKNNILDTILEYQIEGYQKAMFTQEELNTTALDITDPVELWVNGIMDFMKRLPPLHLEISTILYNEMFLNESCRKFVLNTMFKTQKDLTEFLLKDLYKKGLIKECDFRKTAIQYVYMMYGMNIENRLKSKENVDPEIINRNFIDTMIFFIEQLKKPENQ